MSRAHLMNLSLMVLVSLTFAPSAALAFPGYDLVWAAAYPGSATDDNVINGTGTACQLCHANPGGGQPWNAHGWDVRTERLGGATIQDAIALVETLNSDIDPGVASNIAEINADTQPGWTPGPNNTHYFAGGATTPDQMPPAGILGDLDPHFAAVPIVGLLGRLLLAVFFAGGGAAALRARASRLRPERAAVGRHRSR